MDSKYNVIVMPAWYFTEYVQALNRVKFIIYDKNQYYIYFKSAYFDSVKDSNLNAKKLFTNIKNIFAYS